MKRLPVIATALVALVAVSFCVAAEIKLDDVKCVMKPTAAAKADKTLEYKGGQVFFCCDNCPKGFAAKIKEGDKLVAAKGNRQLIQTGQAKQEKCPFTGQPMKEKLEVAGVEVMFCCNNCTAKAKKLEGDEALVAVFGDEAYKKAGFKVGDAKETKDKSE